MTLYAPDGLPIVLLERFEELNISVKCQDDEGTLSLTFGSMDAFDFAKKQWSYVNEADDGKFLFITNQNGCGPDDQRQPYIISSIKEDTATLTTSLAAEAVSLSNVAGSYELDFGHATATQQPQQLQDRGLWGAIENAGQETLNATEGDFNGTKSANFPLNAGQQNQRMNIFTDPQAGLTIDCTNCFISGSLEVTGHFLIQNFSPQELSLTVSPNSVLAALELEAVISASDEPDSQPFTQTLYNGPILDVGIVIEGILDLGATLVYTVGGNLAFSGSATVEFGVNASLPDTAQIIADYDNNGASVASGFDSYQLTPMFHIDNESASVTVTAFSQPEITFGIDLTKVGHVDVAVTIQLPELTATLSVDYDDDGACSHDTGASKTGVMVNSEANIKVDLEIDAKLEVGWKDKDDDEKPLFSTQLYTTSMPLPSACYPLNIPGLVSSANATVISSLSAALLTSTDVSGGSTNSTPSLGLGRRWIVNSTSLHSMPSSYPSTQINTFPSDVRPSSATLSGLGTTLGVTASPSPSSAKPSSMPLSTSPSSSLTRTSSTTLASQQSSNLSSPTSKFSSMTSTLARSSKSSRSESGSGSSSMPLSSTSSSPKTTSIRTPSTSPRSSRIHSSSILPSTTLATSTSKPSQSTEVGSTSVKFSESRSSSILPSTTTSINTHKTSQSTKVASTSAKPSESESSSIQSSISLSSDATKPSQSANVDAATRSNSPNPSKSVSNRSLNASPHISTTASSSLLPDLGSHTVANQPKVSATTSTSSLSQSVVTKRLQTSPSPTNVVDKPTTTSTSTSSSLPPVINTHTAANDPKATVTPAQPSHKQAEVQSAHKGNKHPSQPVETSNKVCTKKHGCT